MNIGLISDTHIPFRWRGVPEVLGAIFSGVELILHAGDVGELWVLDELSAIAPVVAVHGNDDSEEAVRELPYQQLVTVAGRRILLWHSHFPDRAEELASREDDSWERILRRQVERARRAGAEVAVYGHTHIPMTRAMDGVLVVNPGAIASGNYLTRQLRQTVAVMTVGEGEPVVRHVDLAAADGVYEPWVDWDAGFEAASGRYQGTILAPDLQAAFDGLGPGDFKSPLALAKAISPLAHACWAGEQDFVTMEAFRREVLANAGLAEADRALLRRRLEKSSL